MAAANKAIVSNMNANPIETCDIRRYARNYPFLFHLIPADGVLFQCDGDAPSPSKDYGQLQINLDQVVLRWWKITLRNIEGSIYPGEIKDSHEEFYHDEIAQREISRIFGQKTLNHCLNLVRGQIDWLSRFPLNVQVRILSFVNLDDIPQLALVSKLFRSICRNNDLWKSFYARQHGRRALQNKDLLQLAEKRGWRHVFFTNRLKLQMELRREAQLVRHHAEDPSDSIKARQRRAQMHTSPPVALEHDQSSIRRHSFATRKEPISMSPLPNREGSARSYMSETGDATRMPSPPVTPRSNPGSARSKASSRSTTPR